MNGLATHWGWGALGALAVVACAGKDPEHLPHQTATGGSNDGGSTTTPTGATAGTPGAAGGSSGTSSTGGVAHAGSGPGAEGGAGGEVTTGTGGSAGAPSTTVPCIRIDCGLHARCVEVAGQGSCECLPGYGGAACDDVDECLTGTHDCTADHAECVNTQGSFHCRCAAGYTGDGSSCENIDECALGSSDCDSSANCTDTDGSFECSCDDDEISVGSFACKASEECQEDSCQNGGTCIETPGGILCDCPPGFAGADCGEPCSGVLDFADEALQRAVVLSLGRDPEESLEVTDADIEVLTSLDTGSADAPVTSLEGLECMTRLEKLDVLESNLPGNALIPLEHLAHLRSIRLRGRVPGDLQPLANLVGLEELYLPAADNEDATLSDLAPLANLTSLLRLDLSGQDVDDLEPIAGLSRLEELSLSANPLTSVAAVADLKGLEALSLDYSQVESLAPLSGHPSLRWLSAAGAALTTLEGLEDLALLRYLDVSSNPLEDVTAVAALPMLEYARFSSTGLSSTAPFASLLRFGTLDLSGNQIEDLSPLVDATDFGVGGVVWLQGNPFDCIEVRPQIEALESRGAQVSTGCP